MSKRLYILGAGGHAKVVAATAEACGYTVEAIFDDDASLEGQSVMGIPVFTPIEAVADHDPAMLVVGIGANAARQQVAERVEALAQADWATLVHPAAVVHHAVEPGPGTVVFAGAVVQPGAVIGAHTIVNTGATVDHDCRLGAYVHVCPGVNLCGDVVVEDGAWIGVGSAVREGQRIGAWAMTGAGAAVVSDIPPREVWAGVPARFLRKP